MDPTTVLRWGPCEAPEFDQRCRPYLRATHEASRVDETYSKLNKPWYDLYRAVDATGATLDCRLSATREADAAACCFRKVLQASHTRTPRVSTGDKNAAYPPAFAALQPDGPRPETCRLRPCQYLNSVGDSGRCGKSADGGVLNLSADPQHLYLCYTGPWVAVNL